MNIGDKVRGIHTSDAGIVTKIISKDIVEIEIEDGFTIPLKVSDLVIVSSEKSEGTSSKSTANNNNSVKAIKGIYLSFELKNNRIYPSLVNNTDHTIVGSIHFFSKENYDGILSFDLKQRSFLSDFKHFEISQLSKKSFFLINYLSFQKGNCPEPVYKSRKIALPDHKIMTKAKSTTPLSNIEALLFQIDDENKPLNVDQLKEAMTTTEPEVSTFSSFQKAFTTDVKVVDLHIEKLSKESDFLSNGEKLEIQLSVFEKELDQAITNDFSTITFIHGIGSGTLKHAIHKKLSEHPHVKFYEDAEKSKFGYGATKATIS